MKTGKETREEKKKFRQYFSLTISFLREKKIVPTS